MSDDYELEEVLHEFAAEPEHGATTLQRYLRAHPAMAEALVDLSLELRLRGVSPAATVPEDAAWLDASWKALENAMALSAVPAAVRDPFASLEPARVRDARMRLGIPGPVLDGFRNRLVDVATVPERFLRALAAELGSSLDALRNFLTDPPEVYQALSFMVDALPEPAVGKASFEQLLVDARVPEQERKRLLAEVD